MRMGCLLFVAGPAAPRLYFGVGRAEILIAGAGAHRVIRPYLCCGSDPNQHAAKMKVITRATFGLTDLTVR